MIKIDLSADVTRDLTVFSEWTGSDIALRAAARLRQHGLDVEWCECDDHWMERRDEKVGCVTDRGIFHHTEYSAHADIQGIAADGTEVIVRARVTRLGRNGKIRAEILVGAYVGGGRDALGKLHEPRFLYDSRNDPKVAAARALLGLV